jgi:hypothetical protein
MIKLRSDRMNTRETSPARTIAGIRAGSGALAGMRFFDLSGGSLEPAKINRNPPSRLGTACDGGPTMTLSVGLGAPPFRMTCAARSAPPSFAQGPREIGMEAAPAVPASRTTRRGMLGFSSTGR